MERLNSNRTPSERTDFGSRLRETQAGNSADFDRLALPAHVVALLEREGVRDLGAWRALGTKRKAIFGITARTVALLDAKARESGK